jgi:signal transduction histidine kinase
MEAFYYDTSRIMLLWALSRLVIIPALIYLALVMRKLQKAGENLSEGDLSYQVHTKHMIGDFKKHGEDLNRIGEGMAKAVEDRLKSERLKTDLITNVSHDLKTPLTSIVNYAELIGREKTENKKIVEYSEVLLRQSERLNSLIENLVEASKVSSGNIDVYLAPAEVNVLLGQAVGEYEQKLIDGELELIVKQPETPVKIMADGRLLWRVFDNLMNNIVKYAQAGTRVYLTVERIGERALISFKNTSRYALDISPEELLERFVRNDESRSSEGNGLGLSIAQSLTELQGGSLELFVDGDLFKATLEFPTIG